MWAVAGPNTVPLIGPSSTANCRLSTSPLLTRIQIWARMEKFLRAVIPAAERAGVRMALHPDDPPVPEPLGGVAQICSTLEQFRRMGTTIWRVRRMPLGIFGR
ncbi:MAG: hypothetical protein GKR89_26645 [Candidatus Latescibacteria bacterium]|nr:hypothetical protein [Candidatus Latescibacterota bacterium]